MQGKGRMGSFYGARLRASVLSNKNIKLLRRPRLRGWVVAFYMYSFIAAAARMGRQAFDVVSQAAGNFVRRLRHGVFLEIRCSCA